MSEFNYERFNRNSLVYTLGAGITAAAGTRLALQLLLAEGFKFCSFQWPATIEWLALVSVVTTSPCRQGVIYAPAAFLGSGSRFSGSLSGIEPWFPVTRYNHGRPLSYHRVDRSEIRMACRPLAQAISFELSCFTLSPRLLTVRPLDRRNSKANPWNCFSVKETLKLLNLNPRDFGKGPRLLSFMLPPLLFIPSCYHKFIL